jgi:hypothetical protein
MIALNVLADGIAGVPEIVVDIPVTGEKKRPGGRIPVNDKVRAGVNEFVKVTPVNGVLTVRV